MRISELRTETREGRTRISAHITWEDCDRPPQEIYFETEMAFERALACRPEAFLVAAVPPALWSGERRIAVQGEVCPELLDNLRTVIRFFQHWFSLRTGAAGLEVKARARSFAQDRAGTAGFFCSGGLDSLAALRANRASFPPGHPGYVADGIIVHGLEVENEEPFRYVVEGLTALALDAGVTLIPVSTNLRSLNPDWVFWWNGYMGAALAAVAHALSSRLSAVVIASDYDVPHLKPHGSHPLVETNFSSHELRVRYDGLTLSRLDKARLVAAWPPALRHLRVCNLPDRYQRGRLNCGDCEKCLRTMLELLAVGALEEATAFPHRNVPLCQYE